MFGALWVCVYWCGSQVRTVWWEGMSHAQCLISPAALRDVDLACRKQEWELGLAGEDPQPHNRPHGYAQKF
jgi:hypothetical protein